jgi:DNA-binding IclR family transcriptional regulator
MVRPAPAAVRTVEALNFLAAHPSQPFTLSELSRRLGINMASLLAILQALSDAGYVVRHPRHKTYALGPSLVALGHAAVAQHQVVEAARDAMRTLAADVESECVASVVVGEEMVIVATEGVAPAGSIDVRVGQRLPVIPPLGAVFVAWAGAEPVERWLERLGPQASADELEGYRQLVASVRQRGYSLGLDTGAGARLGLALQELVDRPAQRELGARIPELVGALGGGYGLLELDPSRPYTVSNVAAPVFDSDGVVVLALTLNGFTGPLRGDEVAARAGRLVATARSITKAIHGRSAA